MYAIENVERLEREVRAEASGLSRDEARYLVDTYYRWQEHRIALRAQARALGDAGHAFGLVAHFARQTETLERQMVSALEAWTDSVPVAVWAKAQKGIGPVLAAGLSAHIDITRAPTAGAIWRYAGLDPSVKWEKGQKRPWNADLKVLAWKIGDSFVKVSGRDDAFYGAAYRARKAYEVNRDERGENTEAAAAMLAAKNIRATETRATYESGHLPAGQLDARARRWAVKLFLSHWHHVAFVEEYGKPPPLPYAIAHQEHAHFVPPPGWE